MGNDDVVIERRIHDNKITGDDVEKLFRFLISQKINKELIKDGDK